MSFKSPKSQKLYKYLLFDSMEVLCISINFCEFLFFFKGFGSTARWMVRLIGMNCHDETFFWLIQFLFHHNLFFAPTCCLLPFLCAIIKACCSFNAFMTDSGKGSCSSDLNWWKAPDVISWFIVVCLINALILKQSHDYFKSFCGLKWYHTSINERSSRSACKLAEMLCEPFCPC